MSEEIQKTSEETVWVDEPEEAETSPCGPEPEFPEEKFEPEEPRPSWKDFFMQHKMWVIAQAVFFLIVVVIFNTMWSQMEGKIEAVRQSVGNYEQGLEQLNKAVAEMQQQLAHTSDRGDRQDGAIRRGIESQRIAVQELVRLLQVQEALLRSQEGILNGDMTPETPITVPAPANPVPQQ